MDKDLTGQLQQIYERRFDAQQWTSIELLAKRVRPMLHLLNNTVLSTGRCAMARWMPSSLVISSSICRQRRRLKNDSKRLPAAVRLRFATH